MPKDITKTNNLKQQILFNIILQQVNTKRVKNIWGGEHRREFNWIGLYQ